MFKKHLLHGLVAGLGAAIAAFSWNYVFNVILYQDLFDFSAIINTVSILGTCIFSCVLASIGYFTCIKVSKSWGELVFAVIFALICIASIVSPILANLSAHGILADDQTYFPILAIPMHFFPFMAWFTLKPLFFKTQNTAT